MSRLRRLGAAVIWMLLAILPAARASTTLLDQSELVPAGRGYSDSIFVPSAGEVSMSLTDLGFPAKFGSLQFDVSDGLGGSNSLLLVPLTPAGGVVSFAVSGPVTLYADVFTQPGQYDRGLYNLEATFQSSSAVPLPGSGALLAVCLSIVLLEFLIEGWRLRGAMPARGAAE